MKEPASVVISMRVEPELKERAFLAAEKVGMPFNEYIRLLLVAATDAVLSTDEENFGGHIQERFALIGRMLMFKFFAKKVDLELEKLSKDTE